MSILLKNKSCLSLYFIENTRIKGPNYQIVLSFFIYISVRNMQGFQQGLTLFALFITITSAEIKIISFGPLDGTGTNNSIYANHVELVNLYFVVCRITVHIYL